MEDAKDTGREWSSVPLQLRTESRTKHPIRPSYVGLYRTAWRRKPHEQYSGTLIWRTLTRDDVDFLVEVFPLVV